MLFNSVQFIVFYILVFLLYFSLRPSNRWKLLLLSSYVFYAFWSPAYLGLILLSTVVDFQVALRMEAAQETPLRRRYLQLSLFVNLGMLFLFKYLDFFIGSANDVAKMANVSASIPMAELVLPVGISFYTFQTLSYTIDVYRGRLKATRSFGHFALFVAFFPQLVAGPIERASHLLPQLLTCERPLNYHRFISGLTQACYGFFKKIVVADTLAVFVNAAYEHSEVQSGATLWLATYFFAFQIYCDFSGYSDIAIGVARMLGFDFMENFRAPYFSKSVTEFWRRWHISLSSWLRDYLYIPLGGSRNGLGATYRNLIITMLLGGLWHGASWNFVIWGALNGLYLSLEKYLGVPSWDLNRNWFTKVAGALVTFHLIALTWVFFRAEEFRQATGICAKMFLWFQSGPLSIRDTSVLALSLMGIGLLLFFDFVVWRKKSYSDLCANWPQFAIISLNAFFIVLICLLGVSHGSVFIYFQF